MKEYFSRQVLIWGEEGQRKLKETVVLVAGAGGLGTNVVQCLARLGLGKIYIVDHDQVSFSDLNRQVFFTTQHVGYPKVNIIKEKIEKELGTSKVIPLKTKIDRNFFIPEEVRIVIDALDNWETRFILEEKCYFRGIPFIHAGIYRHFGQITTIFPGKTRRLKDIFAGVKEETAPVPSHLPICMIVAGIQAMELIKLVLNFGELLLNRLLVIDLLTFSFEIIPLEG